ncbi:hypothetical protein [Nodularia sp. NIES-3585]|uniref:hypothetical protein n=1 Tax=Nodularia sp. NIES-3585 TaxID=1973477 RepID=UPI000B5C6532|nr:hypothetical protein [Nodularia sp. NIES-3585]GAX38896.1 hypothetical protein NIES3585_49480 [Nodularia sp. NIES-3585]
MSQPPENLEPQQPDVNSNQQADSSTSQNVVRVHQNRAIQGNENQGVLGDFNTEIQGNNNLMLKKEKKLLIKVFGNLHPMLISVHIKAIGGQNFWLFLGQNFGGMTCIQHFTLRLILYRVRASQSGLTQGIRRI